MPLSKRTRKKLGQRIFLIGGPGGAGKDSVMEKLKNSHGHLITPLVRTTTRKPRHYEIDGVHYRFIDHDTFLAKEKHSEMIAIDIYNGEYYGIEGEVLEEVLQASNKLILGVGGICSVQVKNEFPSATLIYLVARPDELRRRLELRGEDAETIARKMREAEDELKLEPDLFDVVIENHNSCLNETVDLVCQEMSLPPIMRVTQAELHQADEVLARRGLRITNQWRNGLHTEVWRTDGPYIVKFVNGKYRDDRLGREADQLLTRGMFEGLTYTVNNYYLALKDRGVKVVPEHSVEVCARNGQLVAMEVASMLGEQTLEDTIRKGNVCETVQLILENAVLPLWRDGEYFFAHGVDLKPSNFVEDGTFIDYIPGRARLTHNPLHILVEFPQPTDPKVWRGKYYRYYVPTGVLRDFLIQICRINPMARPVAKQEIYQFLKQHGHTEVISYFMNSPAEIIAAQIREGKPIDTSLLFTLGNKHPDEYPELCLRDIAFELASLLWERLDDPNGFVNQVYKLRGDHPSIQQMLTQLTTSVVGVRA